jgi:energy-coupling factor transport system permease protein
VNRTTAVVIWVLAALAVGFFDSDPLAQGMVLVGTWLFLIKRKSPSKHLKPLLLGIGIFAVTTIVLNGLLSHLGKNVVITFPSWLPVFGGPVTVEGFVNGGSIALSLLIAVSVSASLSLVIEPTDLVDALPKSFHRAGAALGAALNLVPATALSVNTIREAQKLRGWRPRGMRALVDLVVPVLLSAIDRSVQLAESMEARAFGAQRRTKLLDENRSSKTLICVFLSLLAVGLAIAARLHGVVAWYPYPVPTLPSLSPVALIPPVVITAAALMLPKVSDNFEEINLSLKFNPESI